MAKEDKVIGNIPQTRKAGQPASRWMSPFEELDRLFDDFLSSRGMARPFQFGRAMEPMAREARPPRVDVVDRENEILVRAELPGVDKKDLDISLNENVLTIRGETRREEKEEKGDYYRCEIAESSFARTVPLPSYVDSEKAKASFDNGILELTLPKIEQSKRRKITVG